MSGKCYLQAALHRNLWRSSPWVMGLGWRARGPFRAASFTYLLAFISRPDARHILRCDLPACAPPPLHGCGVDAPRAPAVSLALGESPAGLGGSVTAFRARWEGSTLKCGDCGQFLHPSKQRQLTGPLRGWKTGPAEAWRGWIFPPVALRCWGGAGRRHREGLHAWIRQRADPSHVPSCVA